MIKVILLIHRNFKSNKKGDSEGLFMPEENNIGNHQEVGVSRSTGQVKDQEEEGFDLQSESQKPYSIFSKNEMFFIGIFISLNACWSTLSSALFFPAIPTVSEEFKVSTESANLTVVIYLVFQSVTPMVFSGFADHYGRKPVLNLLLASYIAVCIGLSQVEVYWGLLVLRFAQASSIASTISVSMGMVADLAPRLERGSLSGFINGIVLSGQALGGLLGGALVGRWGMSGIFSFCAIGAGVAFVCNFLFVPETNRTVVGNQSIPPPMFYHYLGIILLTRFRKRLNNDTSTLVPKSSSNLVLSAIKIFLTKLVFISMIPSGLAVGIWNMSMTTLSVVLKNDYKYTDIQVGLAYLAGGVGAMASSLISGHILNWNYRRRKALCDSQKIPFVIHRVRLEFTSRISCVLLLSVLVFGWCLSKKVSVAPILIAQFVISFTVISIITITQTLLIDLRPNESSASASCLNLMRGVMSAIFVAAQDAIVKSLTLGGCFSLLAGIYLLTFIIFKLIIIYDKSLNDNENSSTNTCEVN